MDAKSIVEKVSLGLTNSLDTCYQFMSLDDEETTNPQLKPEYLATVEIAKALNVGLDQYSLTLEKQMNKIRDEILFKAIKSGKIGLADRKTICAEHAFGKKRVDIYASGQDLQDPVLLVEVKLTNSNISGIIEDVNRVVRILDVFNGAKCIADTTFYGAVLFHVAKEVTTEEDLDPYVDNLRNQALEHIDALKAKRPWLKSNLGLLDSKRIQVDPCISQEPIDLTDDMPEDFEIPEYASRLEYSFIPGLILIGNEQADDIDRVSF